MKRRVKQSAVVNDCHQECINHEESRSSSPRPGVEAEGPDQVSREIDPFQGEYQPLKWYDIN